MTPEQVEEDYPRVAEDLIYHLVKEKLIKEHQLKVEDSEVEEMAKNIVREQFANYGMTSVPDDLLEKYSKDMLKKEETLRNIVSRTVDVKFAGWVNEQVKVETKEITREEFEKL
jgi:trigger factor